MKIDVNSPTVSTLPTARNASKVSSGNVASTQSTTQDRTTFSSDTQSVQALTSQAMKSPEVRQDKVDALSQSVKSGQYKPDASKTAASILSNEG
jgi:flagellar biosynthesis anti-sigma factor FlgM